MLPYEIIQLIFDYSGRRVGEILLKFVPDLDTQILDEKIEKATVIFLLMPVIILGSREIIQEDFYYISNHDAEFILKTKTGQKYLNINFPHKVPVEDIIREDANVSYEASITIQQSVTYDDIFDEYIQDTDLIIQGEETPIGELKSVNLSNHQHFDSYQQASEFVQKPFFKDFRERVKETFPDVIDTITTLL